MPDSPPGAEVRSARDDSGRTVLFILGRLDSANAAPLGQRAPGLAREAGRGELGVDASARSARKQTAPTPRR